MNYTTLRGALGRPTTLALLVALSTAACDDEITNTLLPDFEVEAAMTAFADTDPGVGSDETLEVELRNDGTGAVAVTAVSLEGMDAAEFELMSAGPVQLTAGQSTTVRLGFAPMTEGAKSATLVIESDDPDQGRVEIAITGQAVRFQYAQVDRKGIPALNTVFNHPSGQSGFDKTAYNISAPSMDVATYRDQFITVLGAVGNADPAGTADLLLPDELPVSLGATTAFATLTGRTLDDDATDVALFVTVGDPSLQSDNVDANDVAFRTVFPYVAAPHN